MSLYTLVREDKVHGRRVAVLFAYPVGQKSCDYLAGEYDRPLEFEFEGKKLTGDAVDLEGRRLSQATSGRGLIPVFPIGLRPVEGTSTTSGDSTANCTGSDPKRYDWGGSRGEVGEQDPKS